MSDSIDDDNTDSQIFSAPIINDCQLGGGHSDINDNDTNNTEERTFSISSRSDIQEQQESSNNRLITTRTTKLKRDRRQRVSQYNNFIKSGILCLLLLSSTFVVVATKTSVPPRAAKDEKQIVVGRSSLRERVKKRGRQSSKKKYNLNNINYNEQKRDTIDGGVRRKLQRWQASSAWHGSGDTTNSAAQWQPAWPKPHSTGSTTTTKSSKKAESTSTKSSKDTTTTTSYSKDMLLPKPIYKHPTSSPIQVVHAESPTNPKETLSPSNEPTISSTTTPSSSPSYSPSDHPSASPSSDPTDVPSTSPTNLPTVEPSYSPTILPSKSPIVGSTSPTVVSTTAPSMMKEMTTSPMVDNIIPTEPTEVPIQNGTTSSPSVVNGTTSPSSVVNGTTSPVSVGITSTPTYSPSSVTPTYSPSLPDGVTSSPSLSSTSTPTINKGTASPTVSVTVSQRSNIQMKLYGMSETLSNDERIWYQDMTVAYMEQFYNVADDSVGDGSLIRNEVYDMSIQLLTKNGGAFEEEDEVDDDIFGSEGNPGIEDGDDLFILKTTRDIDLEESEDESYLPKFAINARRRAQVIPRSSSRQEANQHTYKTSQQHSSRQLEQEEQTVVQTSVTEPCLGTNPLIITFDIILEYRTSNTQLQDSNLVISFPFSTIEFRTVYIDDYLKNNALEVGSSSEVFDSLYCTSRIDFGNDDDGEDPTLPPVSIGTMSPVVSDNTTAPTYSPSLTDDMTASPTISSMPTNGGISPSSSPSQGKGEGNTTETYMPTFNPTLSSVPTSSNGTLAPSSNTTSLNGTLAPTTSPAPSNMNLTFTTSTLVNETNETTIVDVLSMNDNFTTLVAAVEAANLIDVLTGDGPFTVFGK